MLGYKIKGKIVANIDSNIFTKKRLRQDGKILCVYIIPKNEIVM